MARLWSSGCESGTNESAGLAIEFNVRTSGSFLSIVTTPVHSGAYALRATSFASTVRKALGHSFSAANSTDHRFFRFYFRIATAPSANNAIWELLDSALTGIRVYVSVSSSRALKLFDEDGQIGSDSSALNLNQWYCIEVEYDGSGGAGAGVVRARIDGVDFASSTNRSISTGVYAFIFGGNLTNEAQTAGDWYFDDIGVNDVTGSEQNSWCGEGFIVHLRPNASGDNSDWGRGGADSGSNWGQVDEVTPNDATDYVRSNDILNEKDSHNVATPTFSDSVVRFAAVGVRFRGTTGYESDDFVVRIKASSGGTIQESGTINPNGSTWRTNAPSIPRLFPITAYFQPSTSDRWTVAALTTAQCGYRVSAAGLSQTNISAIWILVEYRPILTSTLTDIVVAVPTLSSIKSAGQTLSEAVVVVVNALKRSMTRTNIGIIVVTGNRWVKKFITLSDITKIMPTYTSILQTGRLFTERIIVVAILLRRTLASIWIRTARTVSNFIGIDKPHC